MLNAPDLVVTLGIALAIQAVFFAFAASLKTDKVTDLSYGLTFIILAAALLVRSGATGQVPALALAGMVIAWGVRLAGYLLFRIMHMKRDARFDGVREHFWPFLKFWFFQGVAVWVIMLPVTLWFRAPGPWTPYMTAGAVVWAIGLAIEAIADQQKFAHKRMAGAKWTDVGLWRVSRHPNYFGELLCWWGVFLCVSGSLAGVDWLIGLLGPLAITGVLLFLTGIPTLEQSADRKWGGDPAYQHYKRTTSILIPWPARRA
jgi:steroid 5-alpha reductase family enzyme